MKAHVLNEALKTVERKVREQRDNLLRQKEAVLREAQTMEQIEEAKKLVRDKKKEKVKRRSKILLTTV